MSYTVQSIANLKDQINIVDVISGVVALKRAGASYKGLCPFHKEKTPSFNVSESNQRYYCFGCQETGDVIEFTKKYYNLDFNDAVESLANRYGITLEETRGSHENLDKYYDINKDAARFFYQSFTEKANKGYAYMKKRGIDVAVLKKFGIGYADEEWSSLYDHLKSKGHKEEDMLELGLISKSKDNRYFDRFRNRVMFPIINIRGKVVGFGGRALSSEDNPKYLNSKESKVFKKNNTIYGLNLSKDSVGKEGYIIMVEGYMDVISLYQSGVMNVGASLGTALTENQSKMIKRYNKVVLCYDADAAGRKAALAGMEVLRKQGLDVRVMHVTDGKDPDEFIKAHGKDAFLDLVNHAKHFGEYKIENAILGLNMEDRNDRILAVKRIAAVLKDLTPGEKDEYASQYAQELGMSKAVLLEEAENNAGNKNRNHDDARDVSNENVARQDQIKPIDELNQIERQLIRLVLANEGYISRIPEAPELISSETCLRILAAIEQNIDSSGNADIDKVLDQLEDDDRRRVFGIMDNVVMREDEETMFKELVKSARLITLQDEVDKIKSIIKYAKDDGAEVTEINGLMNRLKELQIEIVNVKSEEM